MNDKNVQRVQVQALKDFCVKALCRAGVSSEDAAVTADVLVAADLRGVPSHGVAQLRRYVEGLKKGTIASRPEEKVIKETPVTALIDAGTGLGQAISVRAMNLAIKKALEAGAGFVSVRNSNHHGILGYYAMLALPHDCIGLVMTNASQKVVPTFGRDGIMGTNPLAIAAPAGLASPFVLDMATSAVAVGKIEMAERLGKPIPSGWAVDSEGNPATDSQRTVADLKAGAGGVLPLGGMGELLGGHKGFGLAMSVDILTAVLSGAAVSPLTYPKTADGNILPAGLGHFFGAWRIDCFQPVVQFKAAMDDYIALLKNAHKAKGQERIWIPGEKEFEAAEKHQREGIPLVPRVIADLEKLARELKLEWIADIVS